ncbi:MAG: isoprenylcysteine carboxylmethyltransferase family protein [Gemmatimonadales bacterium]
MDLHKAVRDPWVWGQVVLLGAIAAGLPLLQALLPVDSSLADFLSPAPARSRWLALVPVLGGVSMARWGSRSLGPNLTPGTEPLPNGVLVEGGAYRVVRHPLYLGIILLLWGVAWGITNPSIGAMSGLVALAYFDRKAAAEERWLSRRFPGYEAYRNRVPKLLPRWRGSP